MHPRLGTLFRIDSFCVIQGMGRSNSKTGNFGVWILCLLTFIFVLCFCMLPVSMDCTFAIVLSVFSTVYVSELVLYKRHSSTNLRIMASPKEYIGVKHQPLSLFVQ